jgi:hypothetical protein
VFAGLGACPRTEPSVGENETRQAVDHLSISQVEEGYWGGWTRWNRAFSLAPTLAHKWLPWHLFQDTFHSVLATFALQCNLLPSVTALFLESSGTFGAGGQTVTIQLSQGTSAKQLVLNYCPVESP